jgi:N-ethylmaleimide reductase
VKPDGEVFTTRGKVPMVTPRALELHELPGIVEQFRKGAENAKAAGFDGVELHGANGYLLDQFLRDGTNHRTDAYGGSVRNRARLPLEITEAVISVWGAERVGYKIAPYFSYFGASDSNPIETCVYLAEQLNQLKLGYLHVTENPTGPVAPPEGAERITPLLREKFKGTFMVNGSYDARTGAEAIESGAGDLVSYGVAFVANPDLPERYKLGGPLNAPDPTTFYGGEEKGYTDYPALNTHN